MSSLLSRINNLTFNAFVIFFLLCTCNFLSSYLEKKQEPIIDFKVHDPSLFLFDKYNQEQLYLFNFTFSYDITSIIDWNTKIIFLFMTAESVNSTYKLVATVWDLRILREETSLYSQNLKNITSSYTIKDPNGRLRNTIFDIYLNWDHMPVVGFIYRDRIKIGTMQIPQNYTKN